MAAWTKKRPRRAADGSTRRGCFLSLLDAKRRARRRVPARRRAKRGKIALTVLADKVRELVQRRCRRAAKGCRGAVGFVAGARGASAGYNQRPRGCCLARRAHRAMS
jgi:hypothetical protein